MSVILIVDDNPTARETLVAMLEGNGYQLELAKDGFEALNMLKKMRPDLILLDVMMPGMDGFEVCRRIRATPELAEVPILILTALDDRASLLQGIEAGADDFLTKPVDRYELAARVRTITRLNRYRILMEQRENLRAMAERLVTAQEEERQRISRELHDDLGQALTTQLLALRSLQNELSSTSPTITERLQTLYDLTNEIFTKIRRLAHDLRPPALDTLGLKAAMQTYCADFTRRTRLPVTFEADENLPVLSDLYNITLYRVLQEALTNIIKHSRAKQAWVELSAEGNRICLTIQDDGEGIKADATEKGIGLAGMRERLTVAGGKLTITSNPNQGTILTAELPLINTQTRKEKP
ncbi:MAG TPA: response regulator [Anaerolineales bacterium]|nr:response regulator [Anaerolineales bacterium]